MSANELPLPIPADDLSPITHAELIQRLRSHACASRAAFPQARADGTRNARHITIGQERRLVSYLSRALVAAGLPADSTACVRVLVPDLAARPSTRAVHADAPGAVATALRLTFGYRATRRARLPGGTGERFLPVEFRPLLAHVSPTDSFAGQAANLLTMVARAATAAGATNAPTEMPSARAMAAAASTLNGLSGSRIGRAISVYRTLRARAIAVAPVAPFAPVPDGRVERPHGRGLLWALAQRARAGGPQADTYLELVTAGDSRQALRVVFPSLSEDLETYLDDPHGERKKRHGGRHLRRTMRDVEEGICRVAAAILDLGLASPGDTSVDLEWFWTTSHAAPAVEAASNAKMRRRAARAGDQPALAVAPVSRIIADRLATQSLNLSTSTSTGYPQTVAHDLWAAWAVTTAVYGDDLSQNEPELWLRMKTAWTALRERMRTRCAFVPEDRQKQKVRGLKIMPTPYVLAFGLPMLAQHTRRMLARAEGFIARANKLNPALSWEADRDAVRAVDQFADAALQYLVTAIAMWDSLRMENYAYALYGKHVVDVELHTGARVVHTAWSGDPDDRARVKPGKSRAWNLPEDAVDLKVWDGYLSLVRAPRLMRRGVPAAEAIAPNGRYALFVTNVATDDVTAPYSETQISRILFGGGLLWIARNVFGVEELPDSAELIDRKTWHGVFAVHFVRDLKATYLGTVLGEWAAAEEHTLDEVRTLRQHYAGPLYGATYAAAGWNVGALEAWSRRALLGSERVAADALDDPGLRTLVPKAGQATLEKWRREDREEARRARSTVGGVSGGRTRRRRPGQRPPTRHE